MVEQLTSFGVAADDPYAEVGEDGEDDEEQDGGHETVVLISSLILSGLLSLIPHIHPVS